MIGDRFLLEVTGLSSTLRVLRFTAQEGMSELFQANLVVSSEDADVSFDDVIGKPALLTMSTDGGNGRLFHGIVARFRQGDSGKRGTSYHVTLGAARGRCSTAPTARRIFQALSAPAIIQQVLLGAGLVEGSDFRVALQGSYVTRDYCVQYRESDLAFVSRLMEEEGIHYFFDHESDKHTLVLADTASAHQPIPGQATLPFVPSLGTMIEGQHVERFSYAQDIRSGKVTIRDYDFTRPATLLESTASATGSAFAALEVYDHPGGYVAASEGDRLAGVRVEERNALRKLAEGGSVVERLAPGLLFTLSEHARDAFNQEYLITRVEHRGTDSSLVERGDDGDVYANRFECVPSAVAFRPPLVTPRPTIKGLQSAVVVGPSGEEIYTDEYGRVKLQFHWDRLGKSDDTSSCWVRVSQVWAGPGWGAMFLPRVGQEVLVDFLDGDPDRPIVVGRVYHGNNVPPYTLPANRTRSTIMSSSTPGGGGSNELRFEDKAGSEEVYLHAQKDWTIAVVNDKGQTVGMNETLQVGNDRTISVGVDQTVSIGNDESLSVAKDRTKSVGNDESESIANDRTISVGKDHTESIGGAMSLSVAKAVTEDFGDDASETVGKSKSLSVGKDLTVEVSGNRSLQVGSNDATEVKLEQSFKVGSKITFVCGSATVTIEKSGDVTVQGKNLTVKASGDVDVESSGKVTVKASGDVSVEASGNVAVKSLGQMDVTASGPVKVKGTQVGIN